ncbi:bifunctional heptose 7-phosphate kinase/heptose 1-phosphate adenyltransferase [Ferruginibacter albus]|uniref:bifunctional heptose 7-phosphate kinase/heptose 1-phosphate adenyltransferase n=1 Tax=Ferruginibacter albus TaxID=2875540 RepID=UPI001CC4D4E5|nr:bifunctional ADP-heptose synthase [Ferruginibacter albus]UAY50833.1 carbohydrate kinase [Ferruginibacter albus]
MNFDDLFQHFAKLKVAVVGDVMLDTYWWGKVDRISPEAPVPVVAVSKKEFRIGGAGNVALNLQSLSANVFLISVLGKDDDGKQFIELAKANGINTDYLVQSEERTTTNKIRIISRNQQMMRLDAEMTNDISIDDENKLVQSVEAFIASEKPDVIILEDYNKGVLTESCIAKIIALNRQNNIIVTVDPKRKNFFAYKGVDIFKPNLKEVKEALNIIADNADLSSLENIHSQLEAKLQHKISFITLSEKGVFSQSGKTAELIPAHLRNIADVSGAGDTVIAVASLVYAATKDMHLMSEIANIAGGIVCEEVGTVAIDKVKLLQECKQLL